MNYPGSFFDKIRKNIHKIIDNLADLNYDAYVEYTTIEKSASSIIKNYKEELPYVYINEDNTIGHFVDGMEYSNDNGNVWVKYDETNVPVFKTGDVVFVRYCEDENYYASDYVTLNF